MSDFLAEYNQQWAALNAADAAAKAKGNIVGRYIEHPHADGAAIYKITRVVGTKVEIEVVEIGDAWVLPAWGRKTRIARTQAEAFLQRRDGMVALFQRADDWWAQQEVGATVHYANGHNQYVRGVIVDDAGEKKMQPTALVGDWRPYDLPRRLPDGSIRHGYAAEQIVNKALSRPHASNMVECPNHKLRDNNPRTMMPVLLDVPPMTAAQERLVTLVEKHAQITAALTYEHDADPEKHAAAIEAAFARVKKLLG